MVSYSPVPFAQISAQLGPTFEAIRVLLFVLLDYSLVAHDARLSGPGSYDAALDAEVVPMLLETFVRPSISAFGPLALAIFDNQGQPQVRRANKGKEKEKNSIFDPSPTLLSILTYITSYVRIRTSASTSSPSMETFTPAARTHCISTIHTLLSAHSPSSSGLSGGARREALTFLRSALHEIGGRGGEEALMPFLFEPEERAGARLDDVEWEMILGLIPAGSC